MEQEPACIQITDAFCMHAWKVETLKVSYRAHTTTLLTIFQEQQGLAVQNRHRITKQTLFNSL